MTEPGRPEAVTSARFRPVGHPGPDHTVTIDLTGAAADIIHALGKVIPPQIWEGIFHAKTRTESLSAAAMAARHYPTGVGRALTPTLTILDATDLGDALADAISDATKETDHGQQDSPPRSQGADQHAHLFIVAGDADDLDPGHAHRGVGGAPRAGA